jgi:Tol biopolymer transport system component
LILAQLNQFVAQIPGGRTLNLSNERIGTLGSPNGQYGIRAVVNGSTVNLQLVDFSQTPATTKDIPDGTGLVSPSIAWRGDSAGFAFADIPLPDQAARAKKIIYYYDIVNGQSRELVNESQNASAFPVPIAFSSDGRYLIYILNSAEAESSASVAANQAVLLDVPTGQKTPLPDATTIGFSDWLKDGSGYLVVNYTQEGAAQLTVYKLNALQNPTTITPAGVSDRLIAMSPDGQFLVIASDPVSETPGATNIFRMSVDGSNRQQLTQFTDTTQTITGLEWGVDGIYYSVYTGGDQDTVYRMDLDGKNPTQVAQGTLQGIVGLP